MPSTFETNGDLDIINEIEYAINGSNEGMIFVEGGEFEMGGDNNEAKQDELPKHKVVVNSFWMDETEVTNNQFKEFVKATGYVTTAEKAIDWNEIKKILPPNFFNSFSSEIIFFEKSFFFTAYSSPLK